MIRQWLPLGVVFTVAACTTKTDNEPGVPDAGASAASAHSEVTDSGAADAEAADAAKPDSAQSDVSWDGSALSGETTAASTSTLTPQMSDDATSAVDDAGARSAVSCDERKLTCKRAAPVCDYGRVPQIIEGCYAACVRIDDCVCNGADACPQHERYTCNNSRQRCTPYLN